MTPLRSASLLLACTAPLLLLSNACSQPAQPDTPPNANSSAAVANAAGATNQPAYDREALLLKYSRPPVPKLDTMGLSQYDDVPLDFSNDDSAIAFTNFIAGLPDDTQEMREFRRHFGYYLLLTKAYDKKKRRDLRMTGLAILDEFSDEPFFLDLMWEKGVLGPWDMNESFRETCSRYYIAQGPQVMPRLLALARHAGHWSIRARALSLLQRYARHYDPDAIDAVAWDHLLHDPSEDIRGPALEAALHRNDAAFLDLLPRLMNQEDNTRIKFCLTWLRLVPETRRGTHNWIPLLRNALHDGQGWENRWFAMRGLWALRTESDPSAPEYPGTNAFPVLERDAVADIAASLHDDPNWRVRFLAIDTLLDFTNSLVVPALCRSVQTDDTPDIRSYAARVLGIRGDPAAVPTLIDALADKDPFVRYYAAISLGKINDPRAVPPLEAFGPDPEWWVQKAAADALRLLRPPPG